MVFAGESSDIFASLRLQERLGEVEYLLRREQSRSSRLKQSNQTINRDKQKTCTELHKLKDEYAVLELVLDQAKFTAKAQKRDIQDFAQMVTAARAKLAAEVLANTKVKEAARNNRRLLKTKITKLEEELRHVRQAIDDCRLDVSSKVAAAEDGRRQAEALLLANEEQLIILEKAMDSSRAEAQLERDAATEMRELASRGSKRVSELERKLARGETTEMREEWGKDRATLHGCLSEHRAKVADAVAKDREQRDAIKDLEQALRKARKEREAAKREATDSRQAFLKLEVERRELLDKLETQFPGHGSGVVIKTEDVSCYPGLLEAIHVNGRCNEFKLSLCSRDRLQ